MPMPIARIRMIPYCSGSIPNPCASGKSIGANTSNPGSPSKTVPITRRPMMLVTMNPTLPPAWVNTTRSFVGRSFRTAACATTLAAETMNRTVPATSPASRNTFDTAPTDREVTTASSKPYSAATVADSVGVVMPAAIPPRIKTSTIRAGTDRGIDLNALPNSNGSPWGSRPPRALYAMAAIRIIPSTRAGVIPARNNAPVERLVIEASTNMTIEGGTVSPIAAEPASTATTSEGGYRSRL